MVQRITEKDKRRKIALTIDKKLEIITFDKAFPCLGLGRFAEEYL